MQVNKISRSCTDAITGLCSGLFGSTLYTLFLTFCHMCEVA